MISVRVISEPAAKGGEATVCVDVPVTAASKYPNADGSDTLKPPMPRKARSQRAVRGRLLKLSDKSTSNQSERVQSPDADGVPPHVDVYPFLWNSLMRKHAGDDEQHV